MVCGLAVSAYATPPTLYADAGSPLTPSECAVMLDAMMTLSVNETLAADPEVKRLDAPTRAATAKLAKKRALEDPKLAELKAQCPTRYLTSQRDCIFAAKTMNEVDACTAR
jgi:hypothetical protein